MRTTLVTIVNNRGRQISRINKHKKSRKKGLTLPPDSDRIAKLSQRDGAEKAQKAARKREKSWRGKAAGAKRERKNLEKRWKKFLTKRTRCDTIIWLSQTRSGQKRKRFWKKSEKVLDKAKRVWYNKKARTETRRALRTLKIKQRIDKETCNSLRNLLNSKVLKRKRTTRLFQKEKAGVNFEHKRSEIGFKICESKS